MNRLFALALVIFLVACARHEVSVENAWVREYPPGASMTAGYANIANRSKQPLVITGVRAQGFGFAEIHRTELQDGVARMRKIGKLTIEPGQTVTLEPGGMHVMLMRAEGEIGQSIRIEFISDSGAAIAFDAPVRPPGT